MKCLTLTQPWASLVAAEQKRIETRSWKTSYRGPLAIHAAMGFPKYARQACLEQTFYEAMRFVPPDLAPAACRGEVIATCRLVDCVPAEFARFNFPHVWSWKELVFGDFTQGRYAWILADVKRLPRPIKAKGALSLWEWTPPEGMTL